MLSELGSTMAKHVSSRVGRTRLTRVIGGKSCRECRLEVAKTRCRVWVEEDTREAFNAVRALARGAAAKMGDRRARLVVTCGGLGGIPRAFAIGDPQRLEFTWTVDRWQQKAIADSAFRPPAEYREDASVPAASYTLPEHIYFVGEVTAAHFAKTPITRAGRSLMPQGFAITTESVLDDFYKGRAGSQQHGVFRWAKPLSFYLVPEMWCYPMSGRSINLLLVIGTSFGGGGLKYYPTLRQIEMPAN